MTEQCLCFVNKGIIVTQLLFAACFLHKYVISSVHSFNCVHLFGVSASASVFPMNIQNQFPLGWTGWNLLAVQGILKSLLQHHSSEASILQCSAFFTVLLSHPYMTTGKTIALTWRTFVSKVMSLLFNMLSAAAKSRQLCPTLSDPMDCILHGSSIHGIFQARVLEWGAIAFSEYAV